MRNEWFFFYRFPRPSMAFFSYRLLGPSNEIAAKDNLRNKTFSRATAITGLDLQIVAVRVSTVTACRVTRIQLTTVDRRRIGEGPFRYSDKRVSIYSVTRPRHVRRIRITESHRQLRSTGVFDRTTGAAKIQRPGSVREIILGFAPVSPSTIMKSTGVSCFQKTNSVVGTISQSTSHCAVTEQNTRGDVIF